MTLPDERPAAVQTINSVDRGALVRVVGVQGRRRLVHRLAALGVVPGAVLTVVRPRGPALISIGGAKVAVNRNAACAVEVEELRP